MVQLTRTIERLAVAAGGGGVRPGMGVYALPDDPTGNAAGALDELRRAWRSQAKAMAFAALYGGPASTIAAQLGDVAGQWLTPKNRQAVLIRIRQLARAYPPLGTVESMVLSSLRPRFTAGNRRENPRPPDPGGAPGAPRGEGLEKEEGGPEGPS